jgi:hypothetical protein
MKKVKFEDSELDWRPLLCSKCNKRLGIFVKNPGAIFLVYCSECEDNPNGNQLR